MLASAQKILHFHKGLPPPSAAAVNEILKSAQTPGGLQAVYDGRPGCADRTLTRHSPPYLSEVHGRVQLPHLLQQGNWTRLRLCEPTHELC